MTILKISAVDNSNYPPLFLDVKVRLYNAMKCLNFKIAADQSFPTLHIH